MIATAGNNGEKDRSDCLVTIELAQSGGVRIEVKSKVKALFGEQIESLCHSVLAHFSIQHAILKIEDKGALPFVMAARLEAAIKQVVDSKLQYLPEMLPENSKPSLADQPRISRLYLPGNTPSMMLNAGIHKPNGVILDLEDSVAVHKKNEARLLVRNALRSHSFMSAERMVRINQLPMGLIDLDYVVPHHVNLILVPKCESAAQIHSINEKIKAIQKESGAKNPIWLMPIIESALGVVKSYEIAQADNVVALAIGLEDYTADLGVSRTNEGLESLFARSQVVNSSKAAGIQAIDSVFSDVGNNIALMENVKASKALGFEGMGCIHPRQIPIVHENFAPEEKEIALAKRIVTVYNIATEKGLGAVSLGTKMIDAPVVKRALRTIDQAIAFGRLDKNWSELESE
ncbi:MAG TPA: citrate lyase acyl carrier protein [Fulvivirga sp.]|nr:citrate lyase acyl carrier protein [Fulvivirga sp.]